MRRPPSVLRDRGREGAADRAAERGATTRGRAASQPAPAALGLGAGVPLPARERRYFEHRLRADLSGVRVHAGTPAAPALGARAFAAGRDIGFAPGRWQPGAPEGDRLLGHELAHVVQQGATGPAVQLQEAGDDSDAVERALDAAWEAAQKDATINAFVLDPLERHVAREWERMEGWEQGILGTHGGLLYGGGLAALLSNPSGRALLSDVNLAAPLDLIPYATLTEFRYVLPARAGDPLMFRAVLDGEDLLERARGHADVIADMSLRFDIAWAVDPEGDAWLHGFTAHWGVMPGLDLSVGSGVGLPGAPAGGIGGFLSVDVLRLPFIPAPVRMMLGGAPE